MELTGKLTASAGEYFLSVTDNLGKSISTPQAVTIFETGDLKYDDIESTAQLSMPDAENADKENLEFTAAVKCPEALFSGALMIYIYEEDGTTVASCLDKKFIQLEGGRETNVVFSGAMENGTAGKRYLATLVNAETNSYVTPKDSTTLPFTIAGGSGVNDIAVADEGKECSRFDIFTLQGLKVTAKSDRLPRGIYLRRCGSGKVEKIMIH